MWRLRKARVFSRHECFLGSPLGEYPRVVHRDLYKKWIKQPQPVAMPKTAFIPSPSLRIAPHGAQPATLASAVTEKLRDDILNGLYSAGQKLLIGTLRERYDVSTSPVREALNRLASVGLVQQVDQRGFRVAPLGSEDLLELNRTRCMVNALVVADAITHGTQEWEEAVALAYHRLWRCPMLLPTGQVNREWELLHRKFHAAIIATCPSRWLRDFHELLFDCADRHRRASAQRVDQEGSNASHREIMEAVVSRDTERAVALLNDSIRVHLVDVAPES
jgi:DNA-binding GntR family transcriptional regulator